jgi:hypothetical protein
MMDQRPDYEPGCEGLGSARSLQQDEGNAKMVDLRGKMRAALRSNLLYSDYLNPPRRNWLACPR